MRARKFDVEGAWGQFKDTEDWRRDNAIESLYANIGVDSYEAARRMVSDAFDLICKNWALVLYTDTVCLVSAMDWPSRSPRYPRLRF